MKREINPFKVGLFVLTGAAIVIAGLLWIGSAHFFEKTKKYVTFFDQSVRGLNTGSGVDHLGIQVGRVSSISLAQDGRLVRVVMELNLAFKVRENEAVEMKLAGITGGQYLAIVRAPKNLQEVTPKINFPTKYPVIPSARGTISQIENALEDAFKKFQSINAQGLLTSWTDVGQNLNQILSKKEIDETLNNFNQASAALRDLLTGVSRPQTVKEINRGVENFSAAASAASKATASLSRQIEALPPNSFAKLAERMDKAAKETEQVVGSMSSQVDQTISLFQQSVHQMNQVLSDLKGLVQSLREEPGRILEQPSGSSPFGR